MGKGGETGVRGREAEWGEKKTDWGRGGGAGGRWREVGEYIEERMTWERRWER